MDGSDSSRKLTQRRFEVAEPEEAPPAEPPAPTEPELPPPPPLPLRAPSGLELRERQQRWFDERARFEASRKPRPIADEAAK